jgi:uncharacterized membrane protein YqjE
MPHEALPPKLIPALRATVSSAVALAHTRLALAGVELEEEVQRFISAAVLGVVAIMFVLLALIVGTFTVVVAVAPEYRVGTMIGFTALYLVVAVVSVLRVRTIFATRPPIFSGTLAELEKDKEALSRVEREHHAAEAARARGGVRDEFAEVRPASSHDARGDA